MAGRHYSVKLNSNERLEQLLQETYDIACRQEFQIQDEINKMVHSTNLAEATMDEKGKYAKCLHDYFGDLDRCVGRKAEVAKMLKEVIQHGGDVKAAVSDKDFAKNTKLDLKALRESIKDITNDSPEAEVYTIKDYNK